MDTLIKVLIGLSALAFVLAVITTGLFGGSFFATSSEAFSRASTNTALLAIALSVAGRSLTSSSE